jgi:hypothetical protein
MPHCKFAELISNNRLLVEEDARATTKSSFRKKNR